MNYVVGTLRVPQLNSADRTRSVPATIERMLILTQFLFRLSFGLALAMAITSPRRVTSGYFRNHLYVLLGLNVLAALVAWRAPEQFSLWPPLAGAVLSYAGAVAWLYEKPRAGRALLAAVAIAGLTGAWLAMSPDVSTTSESPAATALRWLDAPTSGLLLGSTMAAMFLGHWYLNTPTMELAPLERLVLLMGAAVDRAGHRVRRRTWSCKSSRSACRSRRLSHCGGSPD